MLLLRMKPMSISPGPGSRSATMSRAKSGQFRKQEHEMQATAGLRWSLFIARWMCGHRVLPNRSTSSTASLPTHLPTYPTVFLPCSSLDAGISIGIP